MNTYSDRGSKMLSSASIIVQCDDPELITSIYIGSEKLSGMEVLLDAMFAGAEILIQGRGGPEG